jgi:hypothetical protein
MKKAANSCELTALNIQTNADIIPSLSESIHSLTSIVNGLSLKLKLASIGYLLIVTAVAVAGGCDHV